MEKPIVELTEIEVASSRISELSRNHELDAPVPRLGRWKVRDVVAHLGGVHRWATRIVQTRSMDGPGSQKSKLDGTALCDWFDEGAAQLIQALATASPTEACPNFNPGSDNVVQWWARRQMHETTVHRWDVERAVDELSPIAPEVAADGIDEFLDVFVRTRGKQTLTAPLILTSTRPARSWSLTPAAKPGRVDVAAARLPEVAEELMGRPEDLLLLLWGRLDLSEIDVTVHGSPAVAASLIPPR